MVVLQDRITLGIRSSSRSRLGVDLTCLYQEV
jgi:hypothetical protein